jgi:hypothetical protein
VNFESLAYGGACQSGGGAAFTSLMGLSWNSFRPLDLDNYKTACGVSGPSGYSSLLAANVGHVVALGAGAAIVNSATPFVLQSFVAGAGWINPTTLKLEYYLNTVKQGEATLSLNVTQTGGSYFTGLNGLYFGATDQVTFTPDYSGGADQFNSAAGSCFGMPDTCVRAPYRAWFLDNMTFVNAPAAIVTPEPATFGLLAGGLVLLGAVARRRRGAL